MQLQSNWRILTVGDGDLSFSRALRQHHNCQHLVASIYDPLPVMLAKYDAQAYQALCQLETPVWDNFDVTQPESWRELTPQSFDLVLFQFPLLPGFTSRNAFEQECAGYSVNTLNRALLRRYLQHCMTSFLDPLGAQLCVVTSKDVKPYRGWHIESLHHGTGAHYLGSTPFDIAQFPGYRVRHVDEDRHVKETRGISYFWSAQADHPIRATLTPNPYQDEHCCTACRVGPFTSEEDRLRHQQSRRHQVMEGYEQQWQRYLESCDDGSPRK